jgi:hypothetical protein
MQMQVILPQQNKLAKARIDKKTESETVQAKVISKNVGAEENNNMEDSFCKATSVNNENSSEDDDGKQHP